MATMAIVIARGGREFDFIRDGLAVEVVSIRSI
jgi:hypothetical protein